MSYVVKHCDDLLAKHHARISPLILAVFFIASFGFISPTLLYAAEVTSSVNNFSPVPEEFRPEKPRIFFNTSSRPGLFASSTAPGRPENIPKPISTSTQERLIIYKTARIERLKEALATIEQQARELRTQLENLQVSSPSSTAALNLGEFNKKINNLMQVFKKVNFNYELGKLKTELRTEYLKRETMQKREIQKQLQQNREANKNEQKLLKEPRKNILPGAASTSPEQTPAPSTTTVPNEPG